MVKRENEQKISLHSFHQGCKRGSLASDLAGRVGNLILRDRCFSLNYELKVQVAQGMGSEVKLPKSPPWYVRMKSKMG